MIATDAVGMGLNLNIERIVFTEISKPTQKDGKIIRRQLSHS